MSVRKVPEPKYDKDVKKITSYYAKARDLIIVELLKHVETGSDSIKINQQASLLRQVDVILRDLNVTVQQTIEEGILQSYQEGQAALAYSVGDFKTISEAAEGVAFSLLAKEAVDAIIADTFDDLLSATNLTSRRIKRIVRQTVAEKMRLDMARQNGLAVMKSNIAEELTKKGFSKTVKEEGFVGIVDRKGRKWELNRYVELVVRTKYKHARFEGIRNEAAERGVDLAVISSHGAKDACSRYEGMIISMNGATNGYPTLSELRKGNAIFHPNCKHTIYPIRDTSLLSDEEREVSRKLTENYNNS